SGGLAKGGLKPYFCVYSTFLQRVYDQLLHDVALDNLPVRILIDRAGVVSGDGVTHQGIYDIAMLNSLPNFVLLQPKDTQELVQMMEYSFDCDTPLVIRYPKEFSVLHTPSEGSEIQPFVLGRWEFVSQTAGAKIALLAAGDRCIQLALESLAWGHSADILNASTIKPLDNARLDQLATQYDLLITLEDGILMGGFGQQVLHYIAKQTHRVQVQCVGYETPMYHLDHTKSLDALRSRLKNILQNQP
ncbi:MAG: 1-deoxy-D-xylulose-5-phosphate synthase, partial [Firmicutes bacterium]|nr:1-deoxy-D-xylulose-5-phosphate synthase [Bacillota bacterium]